LFKLFGRYEIVIACRCILKQTGSSHLHSTCFVCQRKLSGLQGLANEAEDGCKYDESDDDDGQAEGRSTAIPEYIS
jgi:hypothetical protein